MRALFFIKYGEISLKGENQAFFLRKLMENISAQLAPLDARVTSRSGRLFLSLPEERAEQAERVLARVFGVVSFSRAVRVEKEMDEIETAALDLTDRLRASGRAFKVEARRTDKSFPLDSYGIACRLGDAVRERFPELGVNLSAPDWTLNVEVREQAYLYGAEKRGPGGLPVGSSGRGLLLLSGGIDSPVAGYLMAGRGLRIECVYFHTHPYTSPKVREKVETLTETLYSFLPATALYVVPFTDIQVKIKEEAAAEELTLLTRAAMMEISTLLASRQKARCLITGESLGQVASQTLQSIAFTDAVARLPVFRPLIGMSKEQIIAVARGIGTYETSILPYPDCCTLFAPEHPLTHPRADRLRETYENLHLDELIREALRKTERLRYRRARAGEAGEP